jgi:acyl-CoA thioester hydrolase
MKEFTFLGEVDFVDTDAGGLAHFTNVLRWVERAEFAWFQSFGVKSFEPLDEGGYNGSPRVSVRCDYRIPMLPCEPYAVVLSPVRIGKTSFTYAFKVLKNREPNNIAAEGEITIVRVHVKKGAEFEKMPLPAPFHSLD